MSFVIDIVTGASQGIGKAIAEYIAFQRSSQLKNLSSIPPLYALVVVGRSSDRGNRVAESLSQSTGIQCVFQSCDLSNLEDVQQLKQNIEHMVLTEKEKQGKGIKERDTNINNGDETDNTNFHVGILVNNAAECPETQELVWRKQKSKDNTTSLVQLDKQFATNVLGYHFMMKIFQNHFSGNVMALDSSDNSSGGTPTHVVNVASNWAGDLDLQDLHFRRRYYDNDTAYRQSKQCDRMLSTIWSDKLRGIALVNSCHPGDPCTTLSTALGYNLGCPSPSKHMIETESPIPYLCGFNGRGQSTRTMGKALQTTGGWYEGRSKTPMSCQFQKRRQDATDLYEICESFVCTL